MRILLIKRLPHRAHCFIPRQITVGKLSSLKPTTYNANMSSRYEKYSNTSECTVHTSARPRSISPLESPLGTNWGEDDFESALKGLTTGQEIPTINYSPTFRQKRGKSVMECDIMTGCLNPKDITLNVTGQNVELCVNRRIKTDEGNFYTFPAVRRLFMLPDEVNAYKLIASLHPGGRLVLAVPMTTPKPGVYTSFPRPVPIRYKNN